MGCSKILQYSVSKTGRAFSAMGRSLLGVKNCLLVLAVTNKLCGLEQNTASVGLHFLSWKILHFPKHLFRFLHELSYCEYAVI